MYSTLVHADKAYTGYEFYYIADRPCIVKVSLDALIYILRYTKQFENKYNYSKQYVLNYLFKKL